MRVIKGCVYSLILTTMLQATVLQKARIPGEANRLQVVSVENGTDSLEFQVFTGDSKCLGLVLPMSTLTFSADKHHKPIHIYQRAPFVVKCSKGSFLPVFIQDGGPVSGSAESGFEGPYYASLWMPYPHVAESSKLHVRYMVKKNKVGKVGIRIGPKGDYRLVAVEDVKFL